MTMLRSSARVLTAVVLGVLLATACSDDPATDPPADGYVSGALDSDEPQDEGLSDDNFDDTDAGDDPDDLGASPPAVAADDSAGAEIRFVSMSTNYSDRTNTLTLDVTRPPGIEPGDVLVAQFLARSTPVSAIQSGWTLVGEQDRQTVWIKEVTDGEPSQYTWMQGPRDQREGSDKNVGSGRTGIILAAYRGVDVDDPVVGSAFEAGSGTSRELVAPSVETDVDGAMVIRMWSTTSPGGDEPGIQPPFEDGLRERGRVYVDIASRAVQTLADAAQEQAGPSDEAVATTTWEVSSSWNHTVVLRPAE